MTAPSPCDICDGRWMWTDASTSHPDPDWYPCPRCLSVPPAQEIRDVADESQFYPWETPGGNYTTGSAWWEPDEQVPLWLPMGLDLGIRVLADQRLAPAIGYRWYPRGIRGEFELCTDPWVGDWPGLPGLLVFKPEDDGSGHPVVPALSVQSIPLTLPARIRAAAAAAVCIRHALGLGGVLPDASQ